ncbi:hypothetical protein V0R48_18940 [Pseudomonas alcaligenes]|uniref:hypothetical protein n=1 Tax=Aquipseudomonas alcaligenes TaxID=43263 RepID=UPI002E7C4E57|nr:hypothetical protein [Pseudomonas alcaligenes]MEE1951059.1 hypothetical protein [Pseudomonas alcaligenes]
MQPTDQVGSRDPSAAGADDVQQALELVRTLLDQLEAEVFEGLAEQLGQDGLLQRALALPRQAEALRDLSIALRELIGLERRQLGIDRGEAARLVDALKSLVARVAPPAVAEAGADGQ